MADLGRWLSGDYRVPGPEAGGEADEDAPAPPRSGESHS